MDAAVVSKLGVNLRGHEMINRIGDHMRDVLLYTVLFKSLGYLRNVFFFFKEKQVL